MLYRKLLRLNSNGDKTATPGKVLNILNNDLRRLDYIFVHISLSIQFPIYFGAAVFQGNFIKYLPPIKSEFKLVPTGKNSIKAI